MTSDRFEPPDTSDAEVLWQAAVGVIAEPSGDRVIVLHPDGAMVSTLNPVGALIWKQLPGTRSELLDRVRRTYPDIDPERLADDLDAFLDEVEERGLIAAADADS